MGNARGALVFVALLLAVATSETTGRSLQQGCVKMGLFPGPGQQCCEFLKVDGSGSCQPCGGGDGYPATRCCDQDVTLPSCLGSETNADRPGNNVGDVLTVTAVELCYKACLDSATCAFFTFTASSGSCQLKDANAAGVPSVTQTGTNLYDIAACRPVLRGSGAMPACAVKIGNLDVKGADLASGVPLGSVEECYDRCINTPGCLYFKWTLATGRCNVKNFLAGRIPAATVDTMEFYDMTDCKQATAAIKNGGCKCKANYNIPYDGVIAPIEQLSCSLPCGEAGQPCCYAEGSHASGTECAGDDVDNTCNVNTEDKLVGTCNGCGASGAACCTGAIKCNTVDPHFCNAANVCQKCGIEDKSGRIPCQGADVIQQYGLTSQGCQPGLVIKFNVCATPPLPKLPAGKCYPVKELFGSPPFVNYFSAANTYNMWNSNKYCVFNGDTEITVDIRIKVVQPDGSCAACPTKPVCQIWHPDSIGDYRGWCSGTFSGNRHIQVTSYPGDESKRNFGYDAFAHLHYACCCGNACHKNKFYLRKSELDFSKADPRLVTPDETNIATQTAANGPNYFIHTINIPSNGNFWFSDPAEKDANDLTKLRLSNPTCYKSTPLTWRVRPITDTNGCKQ